jgi:hypothetical protein
LGKKSDPRVPLSCGTETRTILIYFLKEMEMEVLHKRQEPPILVNSDASLLHEFCDQILCQALNLISLQLYPCPLALALDYGFGKWRIVSISFWSHTFSPPFLGALFLLTFGRFSLVIPF